MAMVKQQHSSHPSTLRQIGVAGTMLAALLAFSAALQAGCSGARQRPQPTASNVFLSVIGHRSLNRANVAGLPRLSGRDFLLMQLLIASMVAVVALHIIGGSASVIGRPGPSTGLSARWRGLSPMDSREMRWTALYGQLPPPRP